MQKSNCSRILKEEDNSSNSCSCIKTVETKKKKDIVSKPVLCSMCSRYDLEKEICLIDGQAIEPHEDACKDFEKQE